MPGSLRLPVCRRRVRTTLLVSGTSLLVVSAVGLVLTAGPHVRPSAAAGELLGSRPGAALSSSSSSSSSSGLTSDDTTDAGTTSGVASVRVHGRLVVVASETPGDTSGEQPAYGVALDDGEIVAVTGHLAAGVRTGDMFDGRVRVPETVTRRLASGVRSSAAAELRVADRRDVPLAMVGTPSVTEVTHESSGAAEADVPVIHKQVVDALDNEGTLGETDAQLRDHVAAVAAYWKTLANGAISRIDTPGRITHYDSAFTGTSCGLGTGSAAFFDIVQEAMAKSPGLDPFGGTDQLVLFVPPSCSSAATVGVGTVGTSFASGGALVVEAGSAAVGTLAHEMGHNFGFAHANARSAGTSLEYDGLYDVMAAGVAGYDERTALSTPLRVYQGITDAGEIQDVELGAGLEPVHATVAIRPRTDDSGVRSVRVTDPDTGEPLYLDYRSGVGQDAGAAYARGVTFGTPGGTLRYARGVTISAARATGGVDTLVVNASGDTSLGQSSTWSSASGRLTVTVGALTSDSAKVTVDYEPLA